MFPFQWRDDDTNANEDKFDKDVWWRYVYMIPSLVRSKCWRRQLRRCKSGAKVKKDFSRNVHSIKVNGSFSIITHVSFPLAKDTQSQSDLMRKSGPNERRAMLTSQKKEEILIQFSRHSSTRSVVRFVWVDLSAFFLICHLSHNSQK